MARRVGFDIPEHTGDITALGTAEMREFME
jgi:hypothetical protein